MAGNRNQAEYAKNLFMKAAHSLQAGDAASARKGLLKVAKIIPDSAAVWYNLGLANQFLGMHQKAIDAYRKSLGITPDQVECWVNIGISHKELHQVDETRKAAAKALEIDPSHPRALNLMGTLSAETGDHETARETLSRSLQTEPGNRDARINLANVEFELGNLDRSLELAEEVLLSASGDRQARIMKARILLQLKAFKEAAPIVMEIEEEFPDEEETLRLSLNYREAIRDYFGAISIANTLLERLPDDARTWNSLGGAYFQLDGIEKSRECYEKAISLEPEHPEYQNNMGLAYSSLGMKEEAEQHFRRSLELNPDHAEAYRNISSMKRFESIDDPDAIKLKEIWEREDLDDFTAVKASFALGKIYDDCKQFDEAFRVYSRGNEIKFRESHIDLDSYFAHIDRVSQVLDAAPGVSSEFQPDPAPVFILGMPRSGTTLAEQIISRHSEVTGCGELPCIERAITRLEKRADPMRAYPDDFHGVSKEELEREGNEYVAWVKRLHEITTPFVTDKMPFNFVHVWLIRAMFPNAPIVHCQRHPLDVITSNYFQLYGSDVSFVYNLEALAGYYIRYFRLMNHWKKVFGDGVYNLQYEAVVADTENQTRALIDAVGLPWQDNCLDQKRSATAVRTASIWQVRQGIYTSSRERWRNYEKHLGPAIDMLATEGILDEDGNLQVQD